jgi:hypothetical protein
LIYHRPNQRDIWDKSKAFVEVISLEKYAIYTSKGG